MVAGTPARLGAAEEGEAGEGGAGVHQAAQRFLRDPPAPRHVQLLQVGPAHAAGKPIEFAANTGSGPAKTKRFKPQR